MLNLLPVQSFAQLPAPVAPDENGDIVADIAIIGSGMGGSTLAYALRDSGAKVVVLERGDFLPREYENWSPKDVFFHKRYRNSEQWYGADGKPFDPGVYYYVGGNTKFYGATLPRFREADFGEINHPDGTSSAWPVGYAELEPFYYEAERLYRVHAMAKEDPTDPWRSAEYPYAPLEHESPLRELAQGWRAQGLHPFSMPTAVDWGDGGRCVRCKTCDGYPCLVDAKCDADVFALRPALGQDVGIATRVKVDRLETDATGRRVVAAVGVHDGRPVRVRAERFVVSAGAVNSAVLLLRSRSDRHPNGLANGSGQVGRNYMVHNSTFLIAIDPRRRNDIHFQKTLGLNDWYLSNDETGYPLGNLQMLGKLQGWSVKLARKMIPLPTLDLVTSHSLDFYLTTEDVPTPDSRVEVDADGRITVFWRPTNLSSHKLLVKRITSLLRRSGYPIVMTQRMGIDTNSHMCGTAVMGDDPATTVLDRNCKAHELDNLWVVDSSCFPSSAAVNPALTIAANTLRVAATGDLVA